MEVMSRHKSPTEQDRKRLQLLHSFLNGDLQIECSCGPDEECSECGVELTDDDLYAYSVNYDSLEVNVRLRNVNPQSKLAMRYNLDDDFADVVDLIEEQLDLSLTASGKAAPDDAKEIERFEEAAMLISQIKGSGVVELEAEDGGTPHSPEEA